jgi:HK97 family phage major capsid protein
MCPLADTDFFGGERIFMTTMTAEKRQGLIKRGGDLHRLALKNNRALTTGEKEELDRIDAELCAGEYAERHGTGVPPGGPAGPDNRGPEGRFTSGLEVRTKRELRPGEIRTVGRKENVADAYKPWEGPGMGMYLRGIVLGKWDGAQELRALAEGSGGGGGYLVPTPLSLTLIDYMRNASKVISAGAVTIPMDSATLKMARLAGDVQTAWKAENAPIPYNDVNFEQVLFTSHTLVSATKISVELIEDSAPAVDSIVSNSMAKSMALGLDYAALYGDGLSNNPVGVKNQPGVVLTPFNGAPTSWAPLSQAASRLLQANMVEPFGAIYSARTAGEFDGLKNTLGDPLGMPPLVIDMEKYVSNQVPNTLNTGSPATPTSSDIFVGAWDQMMVGTRTSLAMEVSREAGDSTGSAFTNLQVWIRCYLRADVQLRHPLAFNVLTGVQ